MTWGLGLAVAITTSMHSQVWVKNTSEKQLQYSSPEVKIPVENNYNLLHPGLDHYYAGIRKSLHWQ